MEQQDGTWVISADGKALLTCFRESDAIKAVQDAELLLRSPLWNPKLGRDRSRSVKVDIIGLFI
jgi:hypothetical protein